MKNITTRSGQTVLDVALQYCGSIESAFTIAELNDIDICSPVDMCIIPGISSESTVKYIKSNNIFITSYNE